MTLQVNMNAMIYNNWYSVCSILTICPVEATFKPLTVIKPSHFMMDSYRYHWTTWLVKYLQLLPMHQNQVLMGDLLLAHPLKRFPFLKWENHLLYGFFFPYYAIAICAFDEFYSCICNVPALKIMGMAWGMCSWFGVNMELIWRPFK